MTDKTMTLEPCPFCGSAGATAGGMLPWVQCDQCGATGPQCGTDEEAITAWNTRHLSQTAERPCSLAEALNVIEHLGRRGNTLHGGDVNRLRALTDKIAPAERGQAVGEKSDVWVVQDETGLPIYCASYPLACHEHITEAINEYEILDAKSWKVLHYSNTTPSPAVGVPDNHVLIAIERPEDYEDVHPELVAEDCMLEAVKRGWRYRVLPSTPSPAIDIAAVREVVEWLAQHACAEVPEMSAQADKLARAIGMDV